MENNRQMKSCCGGNSCENQNNKVKSKNNSKMKSKNNSNQLNDCCGKNNQMSGCCNQNTQQ